MVAKVTSSFKRSRHEATDMDEQGDGFLDLRTKAHTQHKKSAVHKKSLPPLLAPTQKGVPDITCAPSPAGSIQYFADQGVEGRNEDKFKPKKTLLRRSLQHKPIKGSIGADATPIKPSTRQSLDYPGELAGDLMMKPPSQLRERHTEDSMFPNIVLPSNRGKEQITPIKPHPASTGYLQYLADLIPGETDLAGESRPKNQVFLPAVDTAHKGQGHGSRTMASMDPSMMGILEKMDLAYRRGSKNVSRSVFWAEAIDKNRKVEHNLKNSGIESDAVAGDSNTGGRVSRILKKVLVSMEKK